jgi:integrase
MNKRAHGDGGIDRRAEDSYRLRYRVNGKRYAKTFHGSLSDARKELRRLIRTSDVGEHVAPDKITLSEWINQWTALLERKQQDDDGRRKRGLVNRRTLERYEDLLRCHVVPSLGARPLQQIQASEIDNLYIKLEQKLSTRTTHHVHTVLGACLNAAVRKGLIPSSPVTRAEAPVPGESDRANVLDEEQLQRLVEGFKGSLLFNFVAVAAFTGARRNEILALRWSDVSFESKTLTIARAIEQTRKYGRNVKKPKTARSHRTIAIDDNLVELLRSEREKHRRLVAGVPDGVPVDLSLVPLPDDALVFPGGDGRHLTALRDPDAVTRGFVRRATKLGFPNLRLHDLRGTHETVLLDRGVPVHVVAARCGHDPAVLLRTYAKRTKKAVTSAAEVIGALSRTALGSKSGPKK